MDGRALRLVIWVPLVAVIATVLVGPVVARPASAATGDDLLELAELLPDPDQIHRDIAKQVSVDLGGVPESAAKLSEARSSLLDSSERVVRHVAALETLDQHRVSTRGRLVESELLEIVAASVLQEAIEALGAYAVDAFVQHGSLELEETFNRSTPASQPVLSAVAGEIVRDDRDLAAAEHASAVAVVDEFRTKLRNLDEARTRTAGQLAQAEEDLALAQQVIAEVAPAFELALLGAPITGVDFPVVVLNAYYLAQLALAETHPSCGVRWDQLAGIGKVESRHGTFGGTFVAADGRTESEILGPVLDGDPWQAISDTDGGAYDGNTEWDRAVGPMQFIPSSWARYGGDGNDDDNIDPHNMYDAALAAGRHLCGTTGGLDDASNFQRALLGYNRSVPYGNTVMSAADRYREAVSLHPPSSGAAAEAR